MNKFISFFDWPIGYRVNFLRRDTLAGLTVALVLIPQSMAYAELAGLPSYYGLYASFLPSMIASLFGSSRQLSTGPVAVVSLLTSKTLEPLATAGSHQYIAYAILLALLVGVFQFTLGVLKLGLVVNFISHPVVNGFTNAAAIIIASSQLPKIFGVYVDKAHLHYETIYKVIKAAGQYTHWPTLLMGTFAFFISSSGINDIDASGEEASSLTADRVRSAGIDISLSGVNRSVMSVLKRTHLIVKIGEDHICPTVEEAISAIHDQTHRGGEEKNCQLDTVCQLSQAR